MSSLNTTEKTAYNTSAYYKATYNVSEYNISAEEADRYLEVLQYKKVLISIPTYVFLSLLYLVGILGNSLIIRVFSRDTKRTTTSFFIICIALLDLEATLLTIPVTFYVNLRSLFMKEIIVCKIYFFLNFFNGFLSACLLLAVAFVRLRKICYPFSWQVEKHHAHKINAVLVAFTMGVTTPHIIMNGRQTTKTEIPGVHAYQCRVDDAFLNTNWPTIYMGVVNCILFICCVLLIYMYVRIGLKARRQRKMKHGSSLHSAKGVSPNVWIVNTGAETTKQRPKSRTTFMLFTTTLIYVITNYSTILLMLARALNNQLILSLGPVEASIYSLFFNMYLLNCAMNPILYSLSNKKFREKCKDVLMKRR